MAGASLRDRFVLPKPLRKPVRLLARLASSDREPPRFAATMAATVLLGATGLYGMVTGGHTAAVLQAVTARSGFAISEIRVTGNRETSEIDVFQKLGLDGYTSMIGFDATEARGLIQELPWVESASVRKIYPDALEINVAERKPFAIWQQGSQLALIEKDGSVIAPFSGGHFSGLPLVIGMGADKEAAEFVGKIARHPGFASRVTAYIHVAERRWDLRLDNGITVKLPELGEDKAIASLLEMDRDDALLSRDIAAVDLRLSDRLTIQLTPESETAREATMKQRMSGNQSGARI